MTQPNDAQSGVTGPGAGGQSDGSNDDQNRTGQQDGNNSTGNDAQSGGESQQGTNGVTREEYEAIQRRMQAADKRAAEYEQKLKDAERAKMDETERTKAELADAKTALEAAKAELQQARIDNAFLKDNKHKWKNPAAALKLADLSGVKVGEDGNVTGLREALDALAKSDAYLLDNEDGDSGGGNTSGKGQGRTGINPQGNGQQGSNRQSLETKFSGLRGRV